MTFPFEIEIVQKMLNFNGLCAALNDKRLLQKQKLRVIHVYDVPLPTDQEIKDGVVNDRGWRKDHFFKNAPTLNAIEKIYHSGYGLILFSCSNWQAVGNTDVQELVMFLWIVQTELDNADEMMGFSKFAEWKVKPICHVHSDGDAKGTSKMMGVFLARTEFYEQKFPERDYKDEVCHDISYGFNTTECFGGNNAWFGKWENLATLLRDWILAREDYTHALYFSGVGAGTSFDFEEIFDLARDLLLPQHTWLHSQGKSLHFICDSSNVLEDRAWFNTKTTQYDVWVRENGITLEPKHQSLDYAYVFKVSRFLS